MVNQIKAFAIVEDAALNGSQNIETVTRAVFVMLIHINQLAILFSFGHFNEIIQLGKQGGAILISALIVHCRSSDIKANRFSFQR